MDYLEIKEILQLIINAIDNETLWEKHYENLRKIEKDLPESVKQVKDNENAEMPDSLDKLKISDFLKLELNVYGDKNHELVNFLINNIEDIFIPHVFNFKERLKLTLCAACHIDANVSFLSDSFFEFSYDKLVKKFETLENLEMEHNTEEVPVSNTDYIKKLDQINFLLEIDKKNAELHEKQKNNYDETKDTYLKELTESHKTPQTRSATMTGGTTVDGVLTINNYTTNKKVDININEIFEDIPAVKKLNWEGDNLIDKFKNCYNKLPNNEDDNEGNNEKLRQCMFTCLKWISFNGMTIGDNAPPAHNKVFKILNEALKKHIKEKYFPVLNEKNRGELMELVEKNLQDPKWKFSNFTEFLKHFYFTSNDSTGKNNNAIIPQTKKDFDELYLNADINKQTPIALFFDERDSTNDIFKIYIYILFEYLCATTLKHIIQYELEKEKQDIGKMSKHTMRIQDISKYYNSLNDANNPLLRAFLLFVRDCVHVMSNDITVTSEKGNPWYTLEQSLGNHISLEDETIKCDGNDSDTTSLFDYIEKQLKEKGIVDSKINLLVNKAKLIYLLQNYKCF
jgi:hypothetical protein